MSFSFKRLEHKAPSHFKNRYLVLAFLSILPYLSKDAGAQTMSSSSASVPVTGINTSNVGASFSVGENGGVGGGVTKKEQQTREEILYRLENPKNVQDLRKTIEEAGEYIMGNVKNGLSVDK